MTANAPAPRPRARRLPWFLAGLLAGAIGGGALVHQALCYHVLRTDSGLVRLEKASPTFGEAYLDVRHYGPADWGRHRAVVLAIMRAGRLDLLQTQSLDEQKARLGALIQSLQSAEIPEELLGLDQPEAGEAEDHHLSVDEEEGFAGDAVDEGSEGDADADRRPVRTARER